jgi:hypothetical protein
MSEDAAESQTSFGPGQEADKASDRGCGASTDYATAVLDETQSLSQSQSDSHGKSPVSSTTRQTINLGGELPSRAPYIPEYTRPPALTPLPIPDQGLNERSPNYYDATLPLISCGQLSNLASDKFSIHHQPWNMVSPVNHGPPPSFDWDQSYNLETDVFGSVLDTPEQRWDGSLPVNPDPLPSFDWAQFYNLETDIFGSVPDICPLPLNS